MLPNFDFKSLKQYNKFEINISKSDFDKIKSTIKFLELKYNDEFENLHIIEKNNSSKFKIDAQQNFIERHRIFITNIINDVLTIYSNELINLDVVFLSGSFARGTNKMSSDLDLHFYYKNGKYNYIYEEIVCYVISRLIKKSRDSIDSTFIFNVQNENKKFITNKMDLLDLNIILKFKKYEIKYLYKYSKKRRFFLQYTNSRNIKELFDYLEHEIRKNNFEWIHSFYVIRGKDKFNRYYENLFTNEKDLIDKIYIKN